MMIGDSVGEHVSAPFLRSQQEQVEVHHRGATSALPVCSLI
jgi:hypothetical protein